MVLHFEELREGNAFRVEFDPKHRGGEPKQEDGRAGQPDRARAFVAVVNEVAHAQFDGGNHRRERGEGQGEEEARHHQERPNVAARCLREHLGQGQEGDGRGTAGHRGQGIGLDRENRGEDGQAGDDGDAVVREAHHEGVEGGVLVLAHVHRVGDRHAHAGGR